MVRSSSKHSPSQSASTSCPKSQKETSTHGRGRRSLFLPPTRRHFSSAPPPRRRMSHTPLPGGRTPPPLRQHLPSQEDTFLQYREDILLSCLQINEWLLSHPLLNKKQHHLHHQSCGSPILTSQKKLAPQSPIDSLLHCHQNKEKGLT